MLTAEQKGTVIEFQTFVEEDEKLILSKSISDLPKMKEIGVLKFSKHNHFY